MRAFNDDKINQVNVDGYLNVELSTLLSAYAWKNNKNIYLPLSNVL